MLKKDDLFVTVSPTAIEAKQDSIPKPEKRAYKKSLTKKRVPTQAERFQINKLLEEHLTPKDDSGIVAYKHGMSDDKIANLAGSHISMDTVRNMRQQVFGQLRHYVPSGPGSNIEQRITKLEELFNKLAEEIGSALRV